MIKLFFGSIVAAVAMFITGFLFFATPLQYLGSSRVTDTQNSAIQAALAANLPQTGTYMIPDTSTAEGTVMYGKGPIATVHYNSKGFSTAAPDVLIGGFIHEFIICILLAAALSGLDRRIPDFASRAKLVVLYSVAASAFMHLGEPIWYHHDWPHFIYLFIGDTAMLIVAGLILARWFMPVAAEMPSGAAKSSPVVEQPQEPASG